MDERFIKWLNLYDEFNNETALRDILLPQKNKVHYTNYTTKKNMPFYLFIKIEK